MRVANVRTFAGDGVYVGRPSPWGNPFPVASDRAGAIAKFRAFAEERLANNPGWLDPLRDAEVLTCWCAPLPCHADVLIELIDKLPPTEYDRVLAGEFNE